MIRYIVLCLSLSLSVNFLYRAGAAGCLCTFVKSGNKFIIIIIIIIITIPSQNVYNHTIVVLPPVEFGCTPRHQPPITIATSARCPGVKTKKQNKKNKK